MDGARLCVLVTAALVAVGAPRHAVAQPASEPAARQRAQELLLKGNEQLYQGRYLEALASFTRAYEIFPSPRLHFPLAQTFYELGRRLEALAHYEQFVRGVAESESPEQWRLAHRRIFKLQGEIATLHLQTNVPARVTVDGRLVGTTPLERPLRFMPGAHVVILTAPGYERHVIEVTLRAGELLARRIELLTEEEAVRRRRDVQQIEAQRRAAIERLQLAEEQARRRRERNLRLLRTSGWSVIGVGAAAVLTGSVFGLLARHEGAAVSAAATDTLWREVSGHYRRAEAYHDTFVYAVSGGAVVAAAGAVLLYFGRRGATHERSVLVPALGPGTAGFVLAGRY
jgi:tetratricopeptide (TPR) repeat protein